MPGSTTSFNDGVENVSDAARESGNKASDLGRTAADKIDEHRDAAADGIERAASALRENAERLPGGEKLSGLARNAAGKLGASAQYIRENDARGMMADVEMLVKNHPGSSLMAAVALGFLAGRTLRHN